VHVEHYQGGHIPFEYIRSEEIWGKQERIHIYQGDESEKIEIMVPKSFQG
jgi:hypothetical protein